MNYRFIVMECNRIEKFQQGLIEEYEKRLSRYCKTKLVKVKKKKDLTKQWKETNYSIGIVSGQSGMSSEDFADRIHQLGMDGYTNVDFYVCPEDMDQELLPAFHEILTISSMEFQPIVTTGLLYEQVYRAYRILNKEPYHK